MSPGTFSAYFEAKQVITVLCRLDRAVFHFTFCLCYLHTKLHCLSAKPRLLHVAFIDLGVAGEYKLA